jgi:acyl-CoA synthetase (AMP-forming)/AMP-acid ligase II
MLQIDHRESHDVDIFLPERGQVPVAFVLLASDADADVTPQAIEAWCRERMANFKVPEVRIVGALPMMATGKVKKQELAKALDA